MNKKVLIAMNIFLLSFVILLFTACEAGIGEKTTDNGNERNTFESEEKTQSDKNVKFDKENETTTESLSNYASIPEYIDGKLNFTLELTETIYTTSSIAIKYQLKSKEIVDYLGRGDKWILYRIENREAVKIGEISHEISIEYTASGDGYIVRDESLSIASLCGNATLDIGKYCLVFPVQAPDANGCYKTYAGALMFFDVLEKDS